ncbi:MAG: hypothetical protein KBD27_02980 [Candidatus Moranbacteria bacterium]|nr:hypothetical protein [Candidatus Moranbacteria bacterium]
METPLFKHPRLKIWYERATSQNVTIIFIMAFVVGIGAKTLVRDSITIGYDDYTLPEPDTVVDLNTLEKELIKNGTTEREPVPQGDTCSNEE